MTPFFFLGNQRTRCYFIHVLTKFCSLGLFLSNYPNHFDVHTWLLFKYASEKWQDLYTLLLNLECSTSFGCSYVICKPWRSARNCLPRKQWKSFRIEQQTVQILISIAFSIRNCIWKVDKPVSINRFNIYLSSDEMKFAILKKRMNISQKQL